jgi:hypothetical protein
MRRFLSLVIGFTASSIAAQSVDIVNPVSPAHVLATEARTPHGEAAPLPLQNFTVSRGIGIVEDDGNSFWPGFPANFQAPATFRIVPTASNTFTIRRVAFAFDDPAGATILFDGAKRPIVGYLDANYLFPHYTLPTPFTFAGKQYSRLSISSWGAIAFGDADTTQVNYDPTVVSSMFRIPMIAAWYELFYYPTDARVLARNKPGSVVITWQNLLSRHSATRCTFQVELFDSGEMQISYQSLSADHGLVGLSTGTETATHQSASTLTFGDLPQHMQLASATFDDYGGVIAGVSLTLKSAIPALSGGESDRYSLVINGVDVIGLEVSSNQSLIVPILTPRIPDFPSAQIKSWETAMNGANLSLRFPATSIEPFLGPGLNTWAIKTTRFGGAGFVERTITQTMPLTFTVRHALLPSAIGDAAEVPAEIFHYMPGVWDTDRIRQSLAAYLVSRGQNVDTLRFFPTVYDDGLRHANYAGTYPRQKSVSGVGQIPARTETDIYGGEFSAVAESLADETHTQVALTHELVHECAFYADYRDANGTTTGAWRDAGVPCFGGAHPNEGLINTPMFVDLDGSPSAISVMGGSVAGTTVLNNPRFGMSRLEMYLMGLATPAEVTPITFVQGSASTKITIDQIIAANGARTPAYGGQPRVFRIPTFVVKRKGESVSDSQLADLQKLLFRWQSRFWRETGRRAHANLTLDGSCSYTLSITAVKALLTAASGSVNVIADSGCAWTAATSDSWIAITSGANGTGDGLVRYTLAMNTTGTPRTGTITIAGQPYTITQEAALRRRSAP